LSGSSPFASVCLYNQKQANDRNGDFMARTLCMGNEALALGALKAGVNLVSGYPGTPSSEVVECVSAQIKARDLAGVHVEWSSNEKVALEVGAGAAFAGARALVTMKQVGLNVAADALLSLPYLGVRGGLVLVVADDPGPISSQTEQDTRQFAAFAKIPVFDPATPEESFEMIQDAFELSERHNTPVIVRPTTRVSHGAALVDTEFCYTPHVIAGFERTARWVVLPRRAYLGHLEILERLPQIAAEFSTSSYNSVESTGAAATDAVATTDAATPPRIGIASNGISYAYLRDALLQLGTPNPLRLFKVGTPFPFPETRALEFLEDLDGILVLEELEPVIERELIQVAGKYHLPVKIYGRLTGDASLAGENSVDIFVEKITAFLESRFSPNVASDPRDPSDPRDLSDISDPTPPDIPARPPVLCAGCPHRASYYAVKTAMAGRKAVFSADIGCYTLGNALPLDMVDTNICMGGGFTIPQGMHWAQPDVHHFGFLGDSTFFASGLTGVANAVYNQAKITLCVLDNSITAMTGSQPHPGTGIRMSFDATQKDAENALRIPAILQALGVQFVEEVNPFELEKAIEVIRAAANYDGVSAIVFKAPCISVAAPQPQPAIDPQACTNCKVCIRKIGCPALVAGENQVLIDESLCYGCTLCINICPSNAIKATEEGGAR
jgi:indolepyruvate ferredoxin oxidoreductase alpha subunit